MHSPFLVTTQWLEQHIGDDKLIVVDVRMSPPGAMPKQDMQALFAKGHIPGALFFDIDNIADKTSQLPHMLPTAEEFSLAVGALGINEHHTLVFYDDGNQFSAPRGWWTFRSFGAHNVYVLDEGLAGWVKRGNSLTDSLSHRPATHFNAITPKTTVNMQQVEQAQTENIQILDARSCERFYAKAPEPRPGLHRGHIPGSINIPYTELLDNGRFKSLDALQQLFLNKGVNLNAPIITSCGSGVTAATLAFALISLGAAQVKLYDGSWAEWGNIYGNQPIATA